MGFACCSASMHKTLQAKIKKWWQINHLCFLLPAMYHGHEHKWVFLDAGCVGCQLCGVIHVCHEKHNIVPCCSERQDDSSVVCLLTGIVLSTTMFFESEISISDFKIDSYTSMGKIGKKIKVPLEISQQIITQTVHNMMHLLLFSEKAQKARDMEEHRYRKKIAGAFNKHVSQKRYQFNQYNILEGIEYSMSVISKYRKICPRKKTLGTARRHEIAAKIIQFVSKLTLPKPYVLSHQTEKFNNLITSIMYICGDGIVYKGITYLEKFSVLKRILPLELTLLSCFRIQPKVVTDGENVIKMCINTIISNPKKNVFANCEPENKKKKTPV